ELMERLNHVPPGGNDDETAAAVARLEAVAPRKIGRWIAGLMVVFFGVLGTIAFGAWREIERLNHFYDLPHPGSVSEGVERSLSAGRTADERRFLYANSETLGAEERDEWQDACEAELPDDPAELEEF